MERRVILSLSDGETAHLAAMGVTADSRGFLHSASGRPVDAGVAVEMLSKDAPPQHAEHGIHPGRFQRPYLREGHQAERAQGLGGVPFAQQGSRPRPDQGPGENDVAGFDIDGSSDGGPDGMAKGLVPDRFMRPYLTAGHAANSPGATGHYGVSPAPHMDGVPGGDAHVAEPQAFTRGPLQAGHEDDAPQNDPGGNSPHPGGTPAGEVYRTAAGQYGANQRQARTEHVMPSQAIVSTPATSRPPMLPADMRASAVPHAVQVMATKPAPGEG